MHLTRDQILELIQPGDVILVHYMQAGLVSAGIQFASGGTVSHALCCLGGMEIVEADIGGVMHTYLDNYLTGKCRLTIKRMRPELTQPEMHKVCEYWRSCISQPYDFGMIVHAAIVSPIRRLLMPLCPPLGRFVLKALAKITFADHKLSTCAELGARGLRLVRPKFMRSYDADEITPAALLNDATTLEAVRVLDQPVLVVGR